MALLVGSSLWGIKLAYRFARTVRATVPYEDFCQAFRRARRSIAVVVTLVPALSIGASFFFGIELDASAVHLSSSSNSGPWLIQHLEHRNDVLAKCAKFGALTLGVPLFIGVAIYMDTTRQGSYERIEVNNYRKRRVRVHVTEFNNDGLMWAVVASGVGCAVGAVCGFLAGIPVFLLSLSGVSSILAFGAGLTVLSLLPIALWVLAEATPS